MRSESSKRRDQSGETGWAKRERQSHKRWKGRGRQSQIRWKYINETEVAGTGKVGLQGASERDSERKRREKANSVAEIESRETGGEMRKGQSDPGIET